MREGDGVVTGVDGEGVGGGTKSLCEKMSSSPLSLPIGGWGVVEVVGSA